MNFPLGAGSSVAGRLYVSGSVHCYDGIVDRGSRVDEGPDQSDDNNISLGHFSVSDARHDPIVGGVLCETIDKKFSDCIRFDQFDISHRFPLKWIGTDSTTGRICVGYRALQTCSPVTIQSFVADKSHTKVEVVPVPYGELSLPAFREYPAQDQEPGQPDQAEHGDHLQHNHHRSLSQELA